MNGSRPSARLRLSRGQESIWRFEQRFGPSPTYNINFALSLAGPLDGERLRFALNALVARHAILRARFGESDDGPFQTFAAPVDVPWRVEEPAHEAADPAALQALFRREGHRAFRLDRDLPVRATLYRLGRDRHVVLVSLHHLVTDNRSINLMLAEWSALFRGELPELPEAEYAGYVEWQRGFEASAEHEKGLAFWVDALRGTSGRLNLPTDVHGGDRTGRAGSEHVFRIAPDRVAGLRDLAAATGTTLFTVLMAAFQLLMSFMSGDDDVIVGLPVSGRHPARFQNCQGNFVNLLPIRSTIDRRLGFRELVARVAATLGSAYEHQQVPFDNVVAAMRLARSENDLPLVQVVLNYRSFSPELFAIPGGEARFDQIGVDHAKFDLSLYLEKKDGGLLGRFEYATALFDAPFIADLTARLEVLLGGILADPDRDLSSLMPLHAAERERLAAPAGFPDPGPPVPRQVERQAALDGAHVAIRSTAEGELSYAGLEARADRLAGRLRGEGVGRGAVVAICLHPSALMAVAQYAVLKAGAAFLPLDPYHPVRRRREVIGDAGAVLTLADAGTGPELEAAGARVLVLDLERLDDPVSAPPGAAAAEAESGDLAYVIYTSGSTGKPKGVMIEHGSLAHLAAWHRDAFAIGRADRVSLLAGPAFDASVWEIWPALCQGATLCIPERTLAMDADAVQAWLVESRVTVAFAPTPLAELLIAMDWPQGIALRTLLTGGDRLTRRPRPDLPFRLINNYGPTEGTVVATSGPVEPYGAGPIDIGRPLPHFEAFILDRHDQVVPDGVTGELVIAGPSLARGYLGDDRLTAERFVRLEPLGGRRVYRTGDLARRNRQGNIDFLGREDDQVQMLGHRIELGEIEAAVKLQPEVAEAAVIAGEVGGRTRLAAYVVTRDGQPLDPAQLKERLRARLPGYMVPAIVARIDRLPVTSNGKVDKKALADRLAREASESRGRREARTPTERLLVKLWSDALGEEIRSTDDNFFELGGTSLMAASVVARAREALGVAIGIHLLFANPSLAGLARAIDEQCAGPADTPRAEAADRHPLSLEQQRLWFVERLEGPSATYNLPLLLTLDGALDRAALEEALGGLLARYRILRSRIREAGGEPFQTIAPWRPVRLETEDLAPSGGQALLDERVAAEAWTPFDLDGGPLVRWRLFRLAPGRHSLLLTLHHIVCDGGSIPPLLGALEDAYNAAVRGEPVGRDAVRPDYLDYAWGQAQAGAESWRSGLERWRSRLSGMPSLLTLEPNRLAEGRRSRRAGHDGFAVPAAAVAELRRLSREEGASFYAVLVAGLYLPLARMSGRQALTVGVPFDGRSGTAHARTVGMFVNLLPLALRAEAGETLRAWLRTVHAELTGALACAEMPFDEIVKAVRPVRQPGRPLLVQAVLNYLGEEEPEPGFDGLAASYRILEPPNPKFELSVHLVPDAQGLRGRIEFAEDVYSAETVSELAGLYVAALEALAADPDLALRSFLGSRPAPPARPAARIRLDEVLARREPGAGGPGPSGAGTRPLPPRAEVERALGALWREVLAVDAVGPDSDFFELGGHSLLATRILSRVEQMFGYRVPLRSFYARPTLASLVTLLDEAARATPREAPTQA